MRLDDNAIDPRPRDDGRGPGSAVAGSRLCHDVPVDAAIRLGVIDDHRAVSEGVPAGLAKRVPLAPGSVQARTVEELLGSDGEFDVVVLDVRLADGTSPPENVRRLVERGWKVLLYTEVTHPVVLGTCLQAGAMGVVSKKEDWSVLAEAVRTVAGGEDFLNADWATGVEAVSRGNVPALAPREAQVLSLYAAGLPMKSVARRAGIAEETAKEYLARVKRKYLDVGRPARTKTDLYVRAVEDGHLPNPAGE